MRFEFSRLWPGNVKEPPLQVLTMDHDFKEMSRALYIYGHYLRSGKLRNIVVGPRCDECRQSGIAYSHKGEVRILVCRRIENSMTGYFRERRAKLGCDDKDDPLPPGSLIFKGCLIESIGCDKNLKMHLRMRYCWFD